MLFLIQIHTVANKEEFENLLTLLNEKEVLLKERELALDEQQEEFLAQKEELHAAVDEVIAKNHYLSETLERLKVRNNELDQILYRASHDLKTPVSSIKGLITAMRSTAVNAEQHILIDHLLQKTIQMDSLLTSLSRLSTAFFQPLNLERCKLANSVQDAWAQVKRGHVVRFDCRVADVELKTDKALLTTFFVCLLENATTFSRSGVENEIVVESSITNGVLEISVSDGGENIPEELSSKIFEIFFRGSEKSKGPGLGLYIAQIIAQRLNGKLRLENGSPRKKFILSLESAAW